MDLAEPIQITKKIIKVFENLKISYFVGGSLASSLHGIPRATQDVDVVADIQKEHVAPLVAKLKDEFYIKRGTPERCDRIAGKSMDGNRRDVQFLIQCPSIQGFNIL